MWRLKRVQCLRYPFLELLLLLQRLFISDYHMCEVRLKLMRRQIVCAHDQRTSSIQISNGGGFKWKTALTHLSLPDWQSASHWLHWAAAHWIMNHHYVRSIVYKYIHHTLSLSTTQYCNIEHQGEVCICIHVCTLVASSFSTSWKVESIRSPSVI